MPLSTAHTQVSKVCSFEYPVININLKILLKSGSRKKQTIKDAVSRLKGVFHDFLYGDTMKDSKIFSHHNV